jgi:ABC-type phosphate transport system substrate-binding protein
MKFVLFLTSTATAMAASSCGGKFSATGSEILEPIALAWSTGYQKQCPNAKPITITAGGSTAGVSAVCAGTVDIGMTSRDFKSTEAAGSNGSYTCVSGGNKITQVAVALDGITIASKTGGVAANCIKALVSIDKQVSIVYGLNCT